MKLIRTLACLCLPTAAAIYGLASQPIQAQTYYYQPSPRGYYQRTYPNSYYYSPIYYGWAYDDLGIPYYTGYYPGPYDTDAGVYYGGVPATMAWPRLTTPPLTSKEW